MDGFNDKTLVVVEEVSNQAPWHLSRLHTLCQSVIESAPRLKTVSGAMGIHKGRLHIIMVGQRAIAIAWEQLPT